ncbi:MAG TPA: nucleoside hydrolase [Thermoanaerobaculia bacterium]|nr:nucleoside hydrolase [Thermoanaerobaculia bacterium]
MTAPVFIDSDNALGSPMGDVDDAFAMAALLRSNVEVAAIASVAGNTSERRAYDNNRSLAERAGYRGPLLRGADVPSYLASSPPLRIAALGPLTNIAAAIRAGATHHHEIIIVGANYSTRGRWPPLWPHEFNLTHDRPAAREVFATQIPLTIFPLDIARRLTATAPDLRALRGPLAAYLAKGSRRWLLRLRLLKGTGRFPIYDLAATLYANDPEGFTLEETVATMRAKTSIAWGTGTRRVKVCTGFDRDVLWGRFVALLERERSHS